MLSLSGGNDLPHPAGAERTERTALAEQLATVRAELDQARREAASRAGAKNQK